MSEERPSMWDNLAGSFTGDIGMPRSSPIGETMPEWVYWVDPFGAIELGEMGGTLVYQIDSYLNPKIVEAAKNPKLQYVVAGPLLRLQGAHPRQIDYWIGAWDAAKVEASKLYDAYLKKLNAGDRDYTKYVRWTGYLMEEAEINAALLRFVQESRGATLSKLKAIAKSANKLAERHAIIQGKMELLRESTLPLQK